MISLSSDILEIKFSGGDVSPDKISLSELSNNILLFERLVKPIIEAQNPGIVLDKTYVGFHELGNHSISLRYKLKQFKPLLIAAFSLIIEAISENKVENLPAKTVDEIEAIARFNSKYSCRIDFGETIGDEFKPYAHFSDEYVAEKTASLKGSTTVYGKIQWIGGDKPTITLVLTNGSKLDVSVTEDELKKWTAHSFVGIVGDGIWRGKDLQLQKLTAKEIFAFEKKNPNDGFEHLRKLFKNHNLNTDNS
jgi:hypothetical protein